MGGHRGFGHRGGGHIGFRGGRHRARLGYHRTTFHARTLFRVGHHRRLLRNYFRGRRIRYYWGPRHGYYPVPWYETAEYQTQGQGAPQVQSRLLTVTLVPYEATPILLPPGVGAGGVFQFSHPGLTERYLVLAPGDMQPGDMQPVQLMVPPATIPAGYDRVDVLANLRGTPAAPPTIDTDGDGVPDASPFIPGQDGYITVMAVPGTIDQLQVFVPATSLLTLKQVVDAIESWGENALEQRHQANDQIADTVRLRSVLDM